ncbi:MAG: transcription antitermination factor NusB [Acidimicrobiia bacterium]
MSPAGLHERRQARERALELLYESRQKSLSCSEVIDALPVRPDEYAVDLAIGVDRAADALDAVLSRHAKGWTVERMPVIDHVVLRMATWELGQRPDVPTAVVISEAVALAKQFSTDGSGRFVNGVLGAVAEEVRGSRGGPG